MEEIFIVKIAAGNSHILALDTNANKKIIFFLKII